MTEMRNASWGPANSDHLLRLQDNLGQASSKMWNIEQKGKKMGGELGRKEKPYQNLSFSNAKQGFIIGSKCQLIPST